MLPMRQRVEDQKKIRDLKEQVSSYAKPGTAIHDLESKLAVSNEKLKKQKKNFDEKLKEQRFRSPLGT